MGLLSGRSDRGFVGDFEKIPALTGLSVEKNACSRKELERGRIKISCIAAYKKKKLQRGKKYPAVH